MMIIEHIKTPSQENWRGCNCTFEVEIAGGEIAIDERGFAMPGTAKVSGIVIDQLYLGLSTAGQIPNFELKIRGSSGKTAKISLLENNFQLVNFSTSGHRYP
jgi:hypothetical protein